RLAEAAAARAGVVIIPQWRFDKHPQETYMRRVIEAFGVDLILDVGANEGQYSSFLRHAVGFGGWIAAYEPDPEIAARAEAAFASDPRWTMTRCALGPAAGEASFNIMAGRELNSFLRPSDAALQRYAGINRIERTITVEVRTVEAELDRLMAAHGCTRPYLKLDTQGYDLEVLAGAGEAAARLVGVQTEMSVLPIYEGMPDMHTSIARLRELGFELSAMFPVNPHHFPLLIEVDGHFVRQDLMEPKRREVIPPRAG
ncbi:MAG: FkbM family methyltransferase, partial [Elioraea sp.]|nr:FkbM family methyltransferase [Elioraea sp.]